MAHDTQEGIEGRARDVQGRGASDVVDCPRPQTDGSGGQAVDEARQLISKIRWILGQSAVVSDGPHQRRA